MTNLVIKNTKMKYKLGAVEEREVGSYGKLKESQVDGKKVSFWEKSWGADYEKVIEDAELEFDIVEKEKNGYKNFTAYQPKNATTGTTGAYRGNQIAKAQEKKAEFIGKAQDNKNENIKIASTFSSAVNCAIAEYNKETTNLDTLEELIRKWRKTLFFLWDEHTSYPPFLK